MSIKVQFTLACEASATDAKTNVKNVKTIQILSHATIYTFPVTAQSISLHPELAKYPSVEQALKQLDKRGKTRKIKVTLIDDLRKIYINDNDNVVFRNTFLDELAPQVSQESTDHPSTSTKSLASRVKDMICQKFIDK